MTLKSTRKHLVINMSNYSTPNFLTIGLYKKAQLLIIEESEKFKQKSRYTKSELSGTNYRVEV